MPANTIKEFNPFEQYSEGGKLTKQFVDYVLNLVDTNLPKAFAVFRSIKGSGKTIEGADYDLLEVSIKDAYIKLNTLIK